MTDTDNSEAAREDLIARMEEILVFESHLTVWRALQADIVLLSSYAQQMCDYLKATPHMILRTLAAAGDVAQYAWRAELAHDIQQGTAFRMQDGMDAETALEDVVQQAITRTKEQMQDNRFSGRSTSQWSNAVDGSKAKAAATWLRQAREWERLFASSNAVKE